MIRLLAAFALAVLAGIGTAGAQSYPSRPLTIIVPFPAGGATDVLTRFLAERMRLTLDQPVGMLGGITPRAAAKTQNGREKLVNWLKFLENQRPPSRRRRSYGII